MLKERLLTYAAKSRLRWAYILVIGMVLLTVTQDFLRASVGRSSFYLSESFLFTAIWWIFLPVYYFQYVLLQRSTHKLLLILFPIGLHLLIFPAVIGVLSSLFYEHTFAYIRTLKYAVAEHLYQLALLYTTPVLVDAYLYRNKNRNVKTLPAALQVNEGAKTMLVPVGEILYLSAETPYVNLHLSEKTHLYNGSLKAVSALLDDTFIRVHKSTIVQLQAVKAYTSRLNGDYDLLMCNGAILRLSRNYASAFKGRFKMGHPVALK